MAWSLRHLQAAHGECGSGKLEAESTDRAVGRRRYCALCLGKGRRSRLLAVSDLDAGASDFQCGRSEANVMSVARLTPGLWCRQSLRVRFFPLGDNAAGRQVPFP